MAYATDHANLFARAGSYVGEILKGPSQPQPKMFGTFLIKKATSADENVGGHLNAERLRCFEIDDQLGFGRLLHRQSAGFSPLRIRAA